MGILIDTNVFIDVEQSRTNWADIGQKFSRHGDSYISTITAAELLVGVERLQGRNQIKCSSFVEKILHHIPTIEFSLQEARVYARIWMTFLRKRSKGPGAHDLQIASTAIVHGMPLLTSNIKDFSKIPGLELLKC